MCRKTQNYSELERTQDLKDEREDGLCTALLETPYHYHHNLSVTSVFFSQGWCSRETGLRIIMKPCVPDLQVHIPNPSETTIRSLPPWLCHPNTVDSKMRHSPDPCTSPMFAVGAPVEILDFTTLTHTRVVCPGIT